MVVLEGLKAWFVLTNEHTSFTLDDTLHDVLNVLSLAVLGLGQEHSILHQSITVVFTGSMLLVILVAASLIDIGTDSEDDRKKELQLLPGHCLEV